MHQPQHEEQDEAEHGESLHGDVQQSHGGRRGGGPARGHTGSGHGQPARRGSHQSVGYGWDLTVGATSSACLGEESALQLRPEESGTGRVSCGGDTETGSAWWCCCPRHCASCWGLTVTRLADSQLTDRYQGQQRQPATSGQLQNKSFSIEAVMNISQQTSVIEVYSVRHELYFIQRSSD